MPLFHIQCFQYYRYAEKHKVHGIILVSACFTDLGDANEAASGRSLLVGIPVVVFGNKQIKIVVCHHIVRCFMPLLYHCSRVLVCSHSFIHSSIHSHNDKHIRLIA